MEVIAIAIHSSQASLSLIKYLSKGLIVMNELAMNY